MMRLINSTVKNTLYIVGDYFTCSKAEVEKQKSLTVMLVQPDTIYTAGQTCNIRVKIWDNTNKT